MYAPKQFREDRRDVLLDAIRAIRFSALVTLHDGSLAAARIPMIAHERDDSIILEGHVARGNRLWDLSAIGAPALAIFQGPQAYVHPGWLATKRETGRAVPTWNYVAVHAQGQLFSTHDADWLQRHVDDLTRMTETGRPEPWETADAPDGYIEGLLKGIVGLRLEVVQLEGVWKMIQHHPEANRLGVIAGLSASSAPSDHAMAEIMQDREKQRT